MVSSLMVDKPDDPISYLMSLLKRGRVERWSSFFWFHLQYSSSVWCVLWQCGSDQLVLCPVCLSVSLVVCLSVQLLRLFCWARLLLGRQP